VNLTETAWEGATDENLGSKGRPEDDIELWVKLSSVFKLRAHIYIATLSWYFAKQTLWRVFYF
jgi:hypothetical protein